jgi:SAM-dependent methyltransferase
MTDTDLLSQVQAYYTGRIAEHGPTARGVDWNSTASQHLRFERLSTLFDDERQFSILDYGCGYGELARYLHDAGFRGDYLGFDISAVMIEHARRYCDGLPGCTFVSERSRLLPADYAVASGIFNVKLDTARDRWEQYVIDTLEHIARFATRGFAFNMLTHHIDTPLPRADLYYADPLVYFEHCRNTFSRQVALLHDYPLHEFTILVRTP